VRGPLGTLGALAGRLMGRSPDSPERPPAPALPEDMDRGAAELHARLEAARERLRREIPPPEDEDEA
jgi:hypothetical protein